MTESQNAGRSNPLAGKVTIHEDTDTLGVRFVFGNKTDRRISVELEHPLPAGVDSNQVQFRESYHGDAWAVSDQSVSFAIDIDGQSTVETGYAAGTGDSDLVWNAINEGTVTVSETEGAVIGRVTGLEPDVVDPGRGDETEPQEERSQTEARAQGAESPSDVPAANEISQAGDQRDVASVDAADVARLADELDASGEHNTSPADETTEQSGAGDETPAHPNESTAENRANSTETDSKARDWQPSTGAGATTEPTEDSKTADGDTDLPATRADFILSEVRGEIDSASEFEWTSVGDRSKPREILDRVRSWLGI